MRIRKKQDFPSFIFVKRKDKSSLDDRPIYFRLSFQKKRIERTTGVRIRKKERFAPNNIGRWIQSRHSDTPYRNQKLLGIYNFYEQLKQEADILKKEPNLQELADRLTGDEVLQPQTEEVRYTVNECVLLYIKHSKERVQNNEVTQAVLEAHQAKYNNWQKFLKHHRITEVFAEELSEEEAERFEHFCKRVRKFKQNHFVKVFAFMKASLDFAVRKRKIEQNYWKHIYYKAEAPKPPSYLTISQLDKVYHYRYYTSELQHVADLFIFQCYTGLAFADLYKLSSKDMYYSEETKRYWLKVARQKTGTLARVPILPRAMEIIRKYQGVDNLPKITNQHYNKILKIVQKTHGIEERMHTHLARKTFAYLSLNEWHIPLETTAAMLGHRNTKETLKYYAKISEKRIHNDTKHIQASANLVIKPQQLEVKKYGKGGAYV